MGRQQNDDLYYRELILDYLAKHNGRAKSLHAIMKFYGETNYYDRFRRACEQLLEKKVIEKKGREIILAKKLPYQGLHAENQIPFVKKVNEGLLESSKKGQEGMLKTSASMIQDSYNNPLTEEEISKMIDGLGAEGEHFLKGYVLAWISFRKFKGMSKEEIIKELSRITERFFKTEAKRKKFLNGKNKLSDLYDGTYDPEHEN